MPQKKDEDGLTERQRQFAIEIGNGATHAEAMKRAYSVKEGVSRATLESRAHTLMKNTAVKNYVGKIRNAFIEKQLWTREQSVFALVRALGEARTTMEKVACIKELNLMHGYNQPIKVEVGVRPLPSTVDDFV